MPLALYLRHPRALIGPSLKRPRRGSATLSACPGRSFARSQASSLSAHTCSKVAGMG